MASLSKEKSELFFNFFRNMQDEVRFQDKYDYSREVLTYVQADDRYLTYLKDYLDGSTFSDKEKADIESKAQDAHKRSNETLNADQYSFSTEVYGVSQNLYDLIETGNTTALGKIVEAPAASVTATKPGLSAASSFDLAARLKITQPGPELLLPGETPEPFKFQSVADSDPARVKSIVELSVTPETPGNKSFGPLAETANLGHTDLFAPDVLERAVAEQIPVSEPIKPEDFKRPQAEIDAIVASRKPETMAQNTAGSQTTPAVTTEVTGSTADASSYDVKKGDSLWKIAQQHYDLKTDAEIIRAVNTIAHANNMGEGTKANHIKPGQSIQLPDNPFSQKETLDWKALDGETKLNRAKMSSIDLGDNFVKAHDNVIPERRPEHVVTAPALVPAYR